MARKTYKKKKKNGKEYYFYRLYDKKNYPHDIYGVTIRELEDKMKKIKLENDGFLSSEDQKFGDFFKDWLYNTHLVSKSSSTAETYDSTYRIYIKSCPFAKIKMKDLEVNHVQKYYNKLLKEGKSESIIRKIHKLLSPAFRFATHSGKIVRNIAEFVVIPKDINNQLEDDEDEDLIKINPFSFDDQKEFEKLIANHPLEALFVTSLYSGLRQGELFALTWKDINLERKFIDVNKTYRKVKNIDTGKYVDFVGSPKTKASIRIVDIPDSLVSVLKNHKRQQSEYFLRMGIAINNRSLVFPSAVGTFLQSSNVRKRLIKIFRANNLEHRRFHDFRHSYATRLFEKRVPIKTVQVLLGHKNTQTTNNIYIHVMDTEKQNAVQLLDYNGQTEGQTFFQ